MDRLIMEQRGLAPAFDPASLFTSTPAVAHDGAAHASGTRGGRARALLAANLYHRRLPASPASAERTPSGIGPVQRTPTATMRRDPNAAYDTHTPPASASASPAPSHGPEAPAAVVSSPPLPAATTSTTMQRHQLHRAQEEHQRPGSHAGRIPAPCVYAVQPAPVHPAGPLVHQPDGSATVYPSPPWWWRWQEGGEGWEEDEEKLHPSWSAQHAAAAASQLRRPADADHAPHRASPHRVDTVEHERGDSPSPSTPPAARDSLTHGVIRTYGAPRDAATAASSSPMSYTDPALYRRVAPSDVRGTRTPSTTRVDEARASAQTADPWRSASRWTETDAASQRTLPRQRSASAEPPTSSAPPHAFTHQHVALSRAPSATRRLRVYAESATHPSGFAVPRRGAGLAAPVTAPTWLASLPKAVADRSAIARAASAAPPGLASGAAASSHASAAARMVYRRGVAEEAGGVDPAAARLDPLRSRYDRVHTGWRADPSHSTNDIAPDAGPPWPHTTTRLRCGATGGGGGRPAGLYDPVSGLARKPTEVPAAYLQQAAVAAVQGLPPPQVEGRLRSSDKRHGGPVRRLAWDFDASATAPPRSPASSCSSVTATWTDTFGQLAHQRRQRAHTRFTHAQATHDKAGIPLPAEARRLYWAEHAPLHGTAVRGLNALLEGVGEAEEAVEAGAAHVDTHPAESYLGAARGPAAYAASYTDCESECDGAAAEVTVRTTPPHARRRTHMSGRTDRHAGSGASLDATSAALHAQGTRSGAVTGRERGLDGANGLVNSRVDGSSIASAGALRDPREGVHARRASPPPPLPEPRVSSTAAPAATGADVFRYPPLLTPLLLEVDACLRYNNLPRVLDMWRWGAGDQSVVLEGAGFTRAERQTILWELERTVRVTSTRCSISAS